MSEIQEGEKPVLPNAWKIATYVSFMVIIGLVVLNVMGTNNQIRPGSIQSLVVLPFENYTGDDQLEYFVSGMHSSLIWDMGQLSGLRVISETSSRVYKDVDMSVPQIASELKVDAVVESTVMCLSDSICLQVKVFSAFPEEKQLWIADYKEEKSQILNLYNRITKQIANEVKIELTAQEEHLLTRDKTVDKEAYDAYLKALQYWDQLTEEPLRKAMEYMNIAIELDPDFASSHYISALISVWWDWNWEKGEKEFLKALAINPNDAMSRIYYAHLLMILQRSNEALTQGQLVVELDPLNPLILALYAVVLGDAGEYQEACRYAENAVAGYPESFFTQHRLGAAYYNIGEFKKAFEITKKELPFEEDVIKSIDRIFREQGRFTAYEEIVKQIESGAQITYVAPLYRALWYHRINQHDKAIDWIIKAHEIHDLNMPYIATGPMGLDQLSDSARFITILEKMNLPLNED